MLEQLILLAQEPGWGWGVGVGWAEFAWDAKPGRAKCCEFPGLRNGGFESPEASSQKGMLFGSARFGWAGRPASAMDF